MTHPKSWHSEEKFNATVIIIKELPWWLSWSTIHLQCGRPALGSLGWEDPLEKGKATHSSIRAWRIPGTVQSMGSQTVSNSWATFTFTFWASLVAQLVKNSPAVWKTWVQSLGWEDPLEKGMATHSSILSWRTPWTEEPGRLQSMGSQRVRHDWVTLKKKM